MFSDHGMNLEENRRVDLASTLQREVFRCVIPAFGLCSYAAIYCPDDQRIPEVATASVEVTGIDFALYKDKADVVVESTRGQARIEYDPAVNSYRYVKAEW